MGIYYLGLQEQGDSQIPLDDSSTIWSNLDDSSTEADDNHTTTHEDCEMTIAFNFEEEQACTKNDVSSIIHKESANEEATQEDVGKADPFEREEENEPNQIESMGNSAEAEIENRNRKRKSIIYI